MGATRIIEALLDVHGPAGNITDYEHGLLAVNSWLNHVGERGPRIETWHPLKDLASATDSGLGEALTDVWGLATVRELTERAAALLEEPGWDTVALLGLEVGNDNTEFGTAVDIARHHGVDTKDRTWVRLQTEPTNGWLWELAVPDLTEDRLDEALEMIQDASMVNGLSQFRWANVASSALRAVTRFPGHGIPLLEAALTDPYAWVRSAAVDALIAWDPGSRRPDAMSLARSQMDAEEIDHVLARFRILFADDSP